MAELDLFADERPTGPARRPIDLDAEPESRWRAAAALAGAVALGALVLAGRTAVRRPFATLLAGLFLWGAVATAGNLLRQPAHPAPLFARANSPGPTEPARRADPIARLAAETRPAPAEAAAPRERSALVRDLQGELARRGLYQGAADGLHGPRTERAIRSAEASLRLPETGQPSETLLARLRSPAAPERTASIAPRPAPPQRAEAPSAATVEVQRRLADLGYAPGRLTGEMTPEFRRAIQRFQRDNDLEPTGTIDVGVVRRLAAITGPMT
jgi:peptidoglycan hydrolase-like protein with peptidoglycan-binding domain